MFCDYGFCFLLFCDYVLFFFENSVGEAIINFVMVFQCFLKKQFVFQWFFAFCPQKALFRNEIQWTRKRPRTTSNRENRKRPRTTSNREKPQATAIQQRYAMKICNEDMRWRYAMKTCNKHMRWRYAMKICEEDMRWRYAMKICNKDMQQRYAMKICNEDMQ